MRLCYRGKRTASHFFSSLMFSLSSFLFSSFFFTFLYILAMKLLPFSLSVMVCLYVLARLSITFSPATDFIANIFFCFSFLFFYSLNNILTTLPIEDIGDILGLCENIFPHDDKHPLPSCFKLQNVFVSNWKMYLYPFAKCICLQYWRYTWSV